MSDGQLRFDTKLDTASFSKGIGSLGTLASTALKGVGIAAGAAATGFVALETAAINAYGDYEQLVGGVETLFKTSENTVVEYANNAYKTAGLSANEYMRTVTSFSASLLQSLNGDTEAAAQKADMAITDMADNANKMGTAMEDIQNAYQGFAKQNFTMLDNLKLGYGGTKEEMERLLEDATALSGIEYDISSYADIVDAIHVVQENMGITGTTAKEASTTIQGSISSMKASWENFLTGMADDSQDFDMLLNNLIDSVLTVADNLVPRIVSTAPRLVSGLSQLVTSLAGYLPDILSQLLPAVIDGVEGILTALLAALPSLLGILGNMLPMIVNLIVGMLPQILEAGIQIIVQLALGISQALPDLIPVIVDGLILLVETLIDNLDLIIDAGIQLIVALAQGLMNALPILLEKVPIIIGKLIAKVVELIPGLAPAVQAIASFFTETIPEAIENTINWFAELPGRISDFLSQLPYLIGYILGYCIASFAQFGANLFTWITETIPQAVSNIITFFGELPGRIGDMLTSALNKFNDWKSGLAERAGEAIAGMINRITETARELPSRMAEIGANIVAGVWRGIQNAKDSFMKSVKNFFSGIVDGAKEALGIHSPSTKFRYIGEMCLEGYEGAFDRYDPYEPFNSSMKANAGVMRANMEGYGSSRSLTQTFNIYTPTKSPSEIMRAARLEAQYGLAGA